MRADIAETGRALAKLREPFPESEIRYLPRVWCKACRDSRAGCNQHQRQKCSRCRNNISTAHIDLRYVGHAEATNRLLNVDPEWSWEPVASDEKGLPQYDANGGLWIRLTVCGVTRLGYGHAEGKRGGDAVKEIIGDAIRNAGMRFGMALDLWTSSDLEIAQDGPKSDQSDAPERHLRTVQPGDTDQWATPEPRGNVAVKGRSQPAQDFADTAGTTTNQAAVKELYRQANAAGLLAETVKVDRELLELGAYLIARGQQLAEPAPQPAAEPAPADDVVDAEVVDPVDDYAAAVADLRAAAEAARLDDFENGAEQALGCPIADASTDAIRALAAQIRPAA